MRIGRWVGEVGKRKWWEASGGSGAEVRGFSFVYRG